MDTTEKTIEDDDDDTYVEGEELGVVLLDRLDEEVEQGGLVVPVLRVGQLRKVGDIEAD